MDGFLYHIYSNYLNLIAVWGKRSQFIYILFHTFFPKMFTVQLLLIKKNPKKNQVTFYDHLVLQKAHKKSLTADKSDYILFQKINKFIDQTGL